MIKNLSLIFLFLISSCTVVGRPNLQNPIDNKQIKYQNISLEDWEQQSKKSKFKGWDYLVEKLITNKISPDQVKQIFSSSQIPHWTKITFKVRPKEPQHIYNNLNSLKARANALDFYRENKIYFRSAEQKFQIPAEYILAILQVETQCGKNTGDDPIFYWLARLASTSFPPNVKYNFENSEEKPAPSLKEFQERSDWLEEEFLPHVISLIDLSMQLGIHPMDVKGSKGGALGLPQFLPGNISKYGMDGDGNGSVNIFTAPDAIHSIANFLLKHGWKNTNNSSEIRNYILEYNRSSAYADTVFNMAQDLKPNL